MTTGYELRPPSRTDDLDAIEAASDRLLEPLGLWPLPDLPASTEVHKTVIVAGTPAVGFVKVTELDGHAHVAQLSVHPDHGRRGIGTALMAAAEEWAASEGYGLITLTTFADVTFNAPFYTRLGYRQAQATGPELARTTRRERPLEALGARVVMEKVLWQHRSNE